MRAMDLPLWRGFRAQSPATMETNPTMLHVALGQGSRTQEFDTTNATRLAQVPLIAYSAALRRAERLQRRIH